jgi:hypothetical protein
LGRASESLSASCFNSHPPQFKIENSKFTIPPAFLRPSLRVSSPFGLLEGPSFSDAWRHQYAQLQTQNSQLKTVACPLYLVTPAASDHLLCQASPACACDVHRVRLGAAGLPFAHLAQRRRDGRPSGGGTGAVEGARGNGEVPPKQREPSARAGGDRARSARLRGAAEPPYGERASATRR